MNKKKRKKREIILLCTNEPFALVKKRWLRDKIGFSSAKPPRNAHFDRCCCPGTNQVWIGHPKDRVK